jgi:hypothetical protein
MEVEWENASLMNEGEGSQRFWGALPEFVWPAVGDRVWVEGRWVFDCGHTGVPPAAPERKYVKYATEIHPPRALVTFRRNHPALQSIQLGQASPGQLTSAFPASWLPVTGAPATLPPNVPNTGPTNVPLTEADIFVSGNGGGANDLCMLLALNGSDCVFGHTNPVIPVNDFNYVFDIYPPGTDYGHRLPNGTFRVTPPVPNASLQWRTVDHASELPAHTCGGTDTSNCRTVAPIICLIDASTGPTDTDPALANSSCPSLNGPATRLRVILPFASAASARANYFAQSILLGWDDVPVRTITPIIRNFKVTLHALTVLDNGETLENGDWRVFVNVGGQYRYITPFFDRNPDGTNKCNGVLTDNHDDDCFRFDQTPWIVSVQDGTAIHVAVGGFESDDVDTDFCREFPPGAGCNPFTLGSVLALAAQNNDRIGTYEFDLQAPDYRWILPNGSTSFQTQPTNDGERYKVEFRVEEIPAATPATSGPLQIGNPHFSNFVSSSTPLVLSIMSPEAQGFQYRFLGQGTPLPIYPSPLPFPVHWTHANLPPGLQSVPVFLNGVNLTDRHYEFQYSAESISNLLEPRHAATLILDNTAPVTSIVQPQSTTYLHSATLTLSYSSSDGGGSGVASVTRTMDGSTTLPSGAGLQNGQPINLLTELPLGAHTFNVKPVDKLGNTGSTSVTFTIIVTPNSIKNDVGQLRQSNAIKNSGEANSLLAKLEAGRLQRVSGNCAAAGSIYQTFIDELNTQSGTSVDAAAALIMIADAQFLIAHCP